MSKPWKYRCNKTEYTNSLHIYIYAMAIEINQYIVSHFMYT